jgi:DUF4097 and DUF4098 domain-containing protein YvlB
MHAHLLLGFVAALVQQTDTTVSVRPNARLELENFGGSIVVRTWERNQVRVKATHGRRDWVEVSASSSVVRIEAQSRTGMAHTVDYEITAPASINLDLSGTNTSFDLEGVQGEIEAETVQGDVLVSGGGGRIRLESVQGRIVLSKARGRVDVSTVNQGIHLRDIVGDIVAETVNGPIILEQVQASSVDAATVNGTIVYDGVIRDGGDYLMSTHNGTIWVVVPGGSNATVNVSTFNGRFDSSFAVSLRQPAGRRRFSFVLGNGSAKLDLETFGGDVRLRRPGEQRPSFPSPRGRTGNELHEH